jgi:hypothetical protein
MLSQSRRYFRADSCSPCCLCFSFARSKLMPRDAIPVSSRPGIGYVTGRDHDKNPPLPRNERVPVESRRSPVPQQREARIDISHASSSAHTDFAMISRRSRRPFRPNRVYRGHAGFPGSLKSEGVNERLRPYESLPCEDSTRRCGAPLEQRFGLMEGNDDCRDFSAGFQAHVVIRIH